MKRIASQAALVALALAGAGCLSRPQPLQPDAFVRTRPAGDLSQAGQSVGRSGALAYGELHPPLLPDEYIRPVSNAAVSISPIVRQDIPAPGQGVGTQVASDAAPNATT